MNNLCIHQWPIFDRTFNIWISFCHQKDNIPVSEEMCLKCKERVLPTKESFREFNRRVNSTKMDIKLREDADVKRNYNKHCRSCLYLCKHNDNCLGLKCISMLPVTVLFKSKQISCPEQKWDV